MSEERRIGQSDFKMPNSEESDGGLLLSPHLEHKHAGFRGIKSESFWSNTCLAYIYLMYGQPIIKGLRSWSGVEFFEIQKMRQFKRNYT